MRVHIIHILNASNRLSRLMAADRAMLHHTIRHHVCNIPQHIIKLATSPSIVAAGRPTLLPMPSPRPRGKSLGEASESLVFSLVARVADVSSHIPPEIHCGYLLDSHQSTSFAFSRRCSNIHSCHREATTRCHNLPTFCHLLRWPMGERGTLSIQPQRFQCVGAS